MYFSQEKLMKCFTKKFPYMLDKFGVIEVRRVEVMPDGDFCRFIKECYSPRLAIAIMKTKYAKERLAYVEAYLMSRSLRGSTNAKSKRGGSL